MIALECRISKAVLNWGASRRFGSDRTSRWPSWGPSQWRLAAAAEELARHGIEATVIIVSNFNPDPVEDLARLLAGLPHVISVEAQTISGGLAALIGTVIASNGLRCRLWPLAVTDSPDGLSGSQRDCWRRHGIDRNAIVSCALTALEAGSR